MKTLARPLALGAVLALVGSCSDGGGGGFVLPAKDFEVAVSQTFDSIGRLTSPNPQATASSVPLVEGQSLREQVQGLMWLGRFAAADEREVSEVCEKDKEFVQGNVSCKSRCENGGKRVAAECTVSGSVEVSCRDFKITWSSTRVSSGLELIETGAGQKTKLSLWGTINGHASGPDLAGPVSCRVKLTMPADFSEEAVLNCSDFSCIMGGRAVSCAAMQAILTDPSEEGGCTEPNPTPTATFSPVPMPSP